VLAANIAFATGGVITSAATDGDGDGATLVDIAASLHQRRQEIKVVAEWCGWTSDKKNSLYVWDFPAIERKIGI
jgi:hypothetical protein